MRKRQSILPDRAGTVGSARVNQNFTARNRRGGLLAPSGGVPLLEVPEETNDGPEGGTLEFAPNRLNPQKRGHARVPSAMSMAPRAVSRGGPEMSDLAPDLNDAALENELKLDRALLNTSFDARSHIALRLADASPEEIAAYADSLKSQVAELSQREQAAMQRNHQTMLQAAREITALPSKVAQLRKQAVDLANISNALREDIEAQQAIMTRSQSQGTLDTPAGHAPGAVSGSVGALNGGSVSRRNRNSMLMLNNAWAEDLVALFRRVEGAQRFLPSIPGRHVLLESQGWSELNSVTWQSVKPMVLFLLNDHLLAATQKRLRSSADSAGQRLLVVDRCWSLSDISIRNLNADSDAAAATAVADGRQGRVVAQAIQVRNSANGEVVTLRAASSSAADSFTAEYERARVALAGMGGHAHRHSRQASMGDRVRQGSVAGTSHAAVEVQRESAKVVAQIDIELSHRRYASAVKLIQTYSDSETVAEAVEIRRKALVKLLMERAKMRQTDKLQQAEVIKLLGQLGLDVEARTTYLAGRAEHIREAADKVHFHGDIVNYVSQIAIVYFQLILATVEVYRKAYPEKTYSSIIVEWTKKQVDAYVEIFNRQLHRIGNQTRIYQQCVEITRTESAQLQDLGLDMDFLLSYVWS